MKILGIIPARGGSKGIPGKNIKPLGGLPLIGHTIEAARRSGCLDRLWVSTDDPAIARVAESLGVPVPWLRPAKHATDASKTEDCVFHLLGRLKEDEGYVPDAVLLLQPTSPFRTAETIRRAVRLFEKGGKRPVISVTAAPRHPYWCFKLRASGSMVPFCPGKHPARRQDLPPAYCYDGSIYLADTQAFLKTRSFSGKTARAIVVCEDEAVDIDEPRDWAVAEALIRARRSSREAPS